tara:strand:- start:12063 stop:14471 length:2409 start_codon:yes stop_codon:yes gene_type:complete
MSNQLVSISKWFKRFYLMGFLALSMGIPLIFSSVTRSVFEVNKLLFLRIIILLLCGAWLFKTCLLKDNGFEHSEEESYSLFGFKWRRIGLEIPVLFWIITNIISIIISRNVFISSIGAYDRWEGLMTILNYVVLFYMTAKLIDNTRYRILIFCLCLFSTSVSSLYGVVQSLGLDFMNWSKDPVSRVFACINNPVHFCAYVAMITPLGLSLSHYFLNKIKSVSSFITQSYLPILYTSISSLFMIVSLIILHVLDISMFSILTIQFFSIFAIIAAIFYTYDTLVPNRKTILYIISFIIISYLLFLFNFFDFTAYHLTLLALGSALCYCIRAIGNKTFFMYRLCNACTLLVFYSMLLSFSRATIIGYVICIAFFYQLILQKHTDLMTLNRWIMLFFGSALTHIFLIFKVHLFGTYPAILATIIGMISFVLIYLASSTTFSFKRIPISQMFFSFIFYAAFIIPFLAIPIVTKYFFPITCLLLALFVLIQEYLDTSFIKNCLCNFMILNLLFYFSNISYIVFFFILLALLYIYIIKPQFSQSEQFHLTFTFLLKAILVFIPLFLVIINSFRDFFSDFNSFHNLLNYTFLFIIIAFLYFLIKRSFSKLFIAVSVLLFISGIFLVQFQNYQSPYRSLSQYQADSLRVAKTIEGRMTNLSNNKARLYMWLSVPAWIIDNPLFGSGPDTIRHLYPVYRHPQYGIHEGGHNYTPDRLHNEYLNTLSTKGIIGFIIKYIFFYGAWYLLMLKLFLKYASKSKHYILAGIIVAPSIYLVQVLFNFGVVATLFLFYFLLGIGLSFINDEYVDHETT